MFVNFHSAYIPNNLNNLPGDAVKSVNSRNILRPNDRPSVSGFRTSDAELTNVTASPLKGS